MEVWASAAAAVLEVEVSVVEVVSVAEEQVSALLEPAAVAAFGLLPYLVDLS